MHDEIFIHPTSEVSSKASIGRGTKIWQFSVILEGATIGDHVLIAHNVYVEKNTKIGNNVKIKDNVSIFEGVEIEDNVFIGPSATFTNVLTPRSHWPRKNEFLPTHIKQGATIGANATIVCGVTIGRYALIGAGSVVTHDVSDYALVFGVPATQQGWVCFCGAKVEGLNEEEVYYCRTCGSSYKLSKGQLKEIRISY